MIHGLLAVDKPKNITSHAVVEKIRQLFGIQKVGHFGTLDPLAEGLLLIALGKATRFFNFYIKKKKLYAGRIKFGYATSTYDSEGDSISEKKEIDLSGIDIGSLLSPFTGKIMQTPPHYSAKKVKGKPLYKYARQQEAVEIKPVEVEIFSLTGWVSARDMLDFTALTSSGTYIRSLAHDIGQKLNVGAYLYELKRLKIGEFDLAVAVTLEELEKDLAAGHITRAVIPIEALLPEFPKIIVNPGGSRAILNGLSLEIKDILKVLSNQPSEYYRLFDEEGRFLAIAGKDEKSLRFKAALVLSDQAGDDKLPSGRSRRRAPAPLRRNR